MNPVMRAWEWFGAWVSGLPDRLDDDMAMALARHPTISLEAALGCLSILWGIWYGNPAWDVTRRPLYAVSALGHLSEEAFGAVVLAQGVALVWATHRRLTGLAMLAQLWGMAIYGFLSLNFLVTSPEAMAVVVYGWVVGAHFWCLLRVARVRHRNRNGGYGP